MNFNILLSSDNITCEHCINSIKEQITQLNGVKFIDGFPEQKTFLIQVSNPMILDNLATNLSSINYPLSEFNYSPTDSSAQHVWQPDIQIDYSEQDSASIKYNCNCGCDISFQFNRQAPQFEPSICCCGDIALLDVKNSNQALTKLIQEENDINKYYFINVSNLLLPWGQPIELSIAKKMEN